MPARPRRAAVPGSGSALTTATPWLRVQRRGGVLLLFAREQAGQSAAAGVGIRHAVDLGFDRVLLVPGDTPLIEAHEITALLERAERDGTGAVIVPDRHGSGTNALLLAPPIAMAPSFGENSLARHRANAAKAGLTHRVEAIPSLLLDVDTPDDLAELVETLEGRRGQACMTRGTLRQLDRLKVRRPAVAPVRPTVVGA